MVEAVESSSTQYINELSKCSVKLLVVAGTVNMCPSNIYSIPQLMGRKIKPTNERFGLWLLLENLENNNLITDVGNINFTEGETLLSNTTLECLTPLTEPFCDNIMLVKIADIRDCIGEKKKNLLLKKEMCGAFNLYLRGKFSQFVSLGHGVKAKLPFLLENETSMAKGARRVIGVAGMDSVKNKFKTPIAIPYKVELADVKLETLLQELPGILEELQVHDFYLMDFDITQDFAGIFNKREMCKYLTENKNFCFQGEYKPGSNIILDNDKTVGIDCLTWITPSKARAKIYNKFICQLTSPGINKQLGNHVVDFINCPDARLNETFSSTLAKEHGITRLEATIYNYSTLLHPLNDCVQLLEDAKLSFQHAPFYSVSIPRMWTSLTDTLQNSCCLVFGNILQYVYWGNKNTRKLTGTQLKLPTNPDQRKKIISYSLSAFGLNYLPINYIEVEEDPTAEGNISIAQKCYIKAGETYFSRSKTVFSTISKDLSIENCGLIHTKNIIPQVLRKRSNITNKLVPYAISEIKPITPVYLLCAKKRKLEMDEIDLKRRKIDYLQQTSAIKEKYQISLEMDKKIAETKTRLAGYFKVYPWKHLDITGEYKVSAFTVRSNGKFPVVGVLAEKDGKKCVYVFRGFCKNEFIKTDADRGSLKREGYVVLECAGMEIICLPTEESFISFSTNGIVTHNGHSFAKVESFRGNTKTWKGTADQSTFSPVDVEQFNDITMQEISGRIKPRECHRLEELQEGVELTIRGIKRIEYRGKIRYILQFEQVNELFLSNYWLEKELEEQNLDLNYKVKIKLDRIKTTPRKHGEMVVFCV